MLTLFGKGLYLAHLRIDCFLLLVWFILGDWQLGGMGQLLLVEFDLFGQLGHLSSLRIGESLEVSHAGLLSREDFFTLTHVVSESHLQDLVTIFLS